MRHHDSGWRRLTVDSMPIVIAPPYPSKLVATPFSCPCSMSSTSRTARSSTQFDIALTTFSWQHEVDCRALQAPRQAHSPLCTSRYRAWKISLSKLHQSIPTLHPVAVTVSGRLTPSSVRPMCRINENPALPPGFTLDVAARPAAQEASVSPQRPARPETIVARSAHPQQPQDSVQCRDHRRTVGMAFEPRLATRENRP